ncbi:hypothetical protein EST38_g1065 [Candolleomyces aberdarensis]|uniref:DUF1764-domain-containing protein n=1 Tax=Candolleomyces aberdarensis TaxID=2316362 RepID=A0A4Q2DVX4_9AGAR|nr:hypothetical protein EST38_g1065 [Candolleomyces aberdarensis]
MSEIDAIFASKGKARAKAIDPQPAEAPALKPSKKKKKAKKNKSDPQPVTEDAPATSKKRPAPETIVDPSVQISQKRQKTELPSEQGAKQKSKPKKNKEEEEAFRDSRGTGPRRKTDEGWNIYKEDELGISNEGGDTHLCPFDCDCCF